MKVAIGQDSHRFEDESSKKVLILGGVEIPSCPGLLGNSDADVVLHAITNAISGITGTNILGKIADELCQSGTTDSSVYLLEALKYLDPSLKISHLSISIEGKRPKFAPHIDRMKSRIAELLGISTSSVGITATTGEGLTSFGRGEGLQVLCILTVE